MNRFSSLQNALPLSIQEIPVMDLDSWRNEILKICRESKGRLIALFSAPAGKVSRLFGVVGIDQHGELRVGATDLGPNRSYASLTPELPEAHLFERELFEEEGILPEGHPWRKPVRKHETGPEGAYPFYEIAGEEIHEVAVGPVHAGIIEPGHFRFQCHGEKVLHLEIRLGYQHRGVEKLLPKSKPTRRAVLAESVAGDTVVGHALTYAHAIEALAGRSVPQRAKWLRVVVLELERLSNHIGDLGALGADIGFLPASAYFGRLRGEFLNLLMELTGNRYGRSFIRPGGVLTDLSEKKRVDFQRRLAVTSREIREVADLFFSTSSVLARLEHTGVVTREIAQSLGLVGPAARASNLIRDIRHDYPTGAYRFHYIPPVRLTSGDVYARARIRSLEGKRSLEFLEEALKALPPDKIFHLCEGLQASSLVVSLIEGWRGEIAHIAMTDARGEIDRYKIVDPSFHNWMGLSLAMRDGQISDFPLCNKSFNLSYAGHDL
ncbi:MAG: hydrogenase [Deltaproteobacteria bacterium]|nr:hydrogenase [Deltaproteobacteria bacterium]